MYSNLINSVMYSDLVFHHHTGLGDHFICNAIVHEYAKQAERLHIPTHHRYVETLECLYSDFPNIIVHGFNDDWATLEREMFPWAQRMGYPVVRLGFEKLYYREMARKNTPRGPGEAYPEKFAPNFERQFYEQAGLLFRDRYEKFVLPKNIPDVDRVYDELTEGAKDYIIVHKNSSFRSEYPIDIISWRNEELTDKIIEIRKGPTNNVLAYMKLIENAKEIHCINSGFFHLVDSVCTEISANLFYHDIRYNTMQQINCKATGFNRWNVLRYSKLM